MPSEIVGGIRFHTQVLGSAGSPIVLLHGMSDTLANWYFTVAPLLAKTHRVLMYDLRGHGLSEAAPTGYDVPTMAADLHGLVDRFAPDEPVTVVAHSYAGAIVLRFALDHPERVARVVIVDSPLPITLATTLELLLRPEGRAEGAGDAEIELTPEFIASYVTNSVAWNLRDLTSSQKEAFRSRGRRERRLMERAATFALETGGLEDLTKTPDIPDAELARIHCPVLLCYGTETLPAMASTCVRLTAVLPNNTVRMFDTGHSIPRERPHALGEAILEFCDG